jgi:hypothetical protein
MQTLTNSDWIAASSAFVALCALAATIWQGYLARQYARLSVLPHLDIEVVASDTDISKVAIKNGGLGPAILEHLEISFDGTIHVIRAISDYDPILQELLKPIETLRAGYFAPDSQTVISPNESWTMLTVDSKSKGEETRDSFIAFFRKARIKVHYKCLYGTKHTAEYQPHTAA